MAQLMFDKEEYKKWMALPETKKIEVNERAIEALCAVAYQQLEFIEEWKKTPQNDKEVGHIYVFNTAQTFWNNVALMLHLGESQEFANFAFYPCRSCTEIFLQFFYFCKQDQKTKDRIAVKELLRPTVRLHLRDKQENVNEPSYSKLYNLYKNELGLPELDSITDKNLENFEKDRLKSFPGMRRLCKEFDEKKAHIHYFLYQYLCESAHGKILSNIIRGSSSEQEEYRRALMMIFSFAKEILVLLDRDFLESKFRPDIQKAIKDADVLIRNSIL